MSNEAGVLGNVLISHPNLHPIIQAVREKYDIPEITSEDNVLIEILLSEKNIDWDAVRKDVEEHISSTSNLLPEEYLKIYKLFENDDPVPPELKNRNDVPEDIRKSMIDAYRLLRSMLRPMKVQVDQYYITLADRAIENLMTGKNRPVPEGWIGSVYVTEFLGNKTVVAMIGQLGDPKEISSEFRSKYTETFGSDRPNLNEESVTTARYLSLKLDGMTIRDIADVYIERNPDKFPDELGSPKYKYEKSKLEGRMKKKIQRLQIDINKLVGDK